MSSYIETVICEVPAPVSEPGNDEREQLLCNLEALLFVTGEPLPLQKLANLTGCSVNEVAECIAELEERYAKCGITIRTVGGGYRFATAPCARQAVELLLLPPKTSLSPAALETLAIVAYSQPITKAEIEAVRGVSVDGIVSSLVEKGFLVEAGRKEALGRPMLFVTTQEFLQSFGLVSLADLPPLPAEQTERLAEAGEVLKALEGTTESGISSPEITVEIVRTPDASNETTETHDMMDLSSTQGETISQP